MRLRQGDLRSADPQFRQALEVATKLNDPEGRVVALIDLAIVAQLRKNPADKTFLERALDIALDQAPDSYVFNLHGQIVLRYLLAGAPATRQQIHDITLKLTGALDRIDGKSPSYPRLAYDLALLLCAWNDPSMYKASIDIVLDPSTKWDDISVGAHLFIDTIHVERRYNVKCIFGTEKMDLSKI